MSFRIARRAADVHRATEIDQRNPELRSAATPQCALGLRDYHFKRWTNDTFNQMPAPRRPVGEAQHDVNVQARLSIVSHRKVADRAQHFTLLVDGDLAIRLVREIKPADNRALERSDRGERSTADLLFIRIASQFRECFGATVEDDDMDFRRGRRTRDDPGLHEGTSGTANDTAKPRFPVGRNLTPL